MRFSQRQVSGVEAIEEIIKACDVVRVGFAVNNTPYIVPMNFGYKDMVFYFHGAKEGQKIAMIKANPNVCFELDTDHQLISDSDRACDWTMKYASVMGTGSMVIVEDPHEKRMALDILMQNYGGQGSYDYQDRMIDQIGILKLKVSTMTGKRSS